jgi:hypothetical protein
MTKEDLQRATLKEYLIELDRYNFERRELLISSSAPSPIKRIAKIEEKHNLDAFHQHEAQKAIDLAKSWKVVGLKAMEKGLLDVGSVSWTFMVAAYICSLHKEGATASLVTDESRFCLNFESVLEMA